jgi:ABC-type polysaccharide/polyol phosphate transport system ATPase subunit
MSKQRCRFEDTLKRLVIPIVMVSHDTAQVDRFCDRRIDLGTRVRVQQVLQKESLTASNRSLRRIKKQMQFAYCIQIAWKRVIRESLYCFFCPDD